MSIDPVLPNANTGGSFNRYVYAKNSPYRYIDPDGRNAADKFKKLGITVRNQNVTTHPKTGVQFKGYEKLPHSLHCRFVRCVNRCALLAPFGFA